MSKTVPHIDTEFRDLLPHSRPEERALLQESIKREGLRDPIVVWKETGAILDGNNRNEICDALKIKPTFRKVSLKNRAAAELWIITNQLGRRNLHPDHYAYFEGQRFERTKGKHGGSRPQNGALKSRTREIIAKESNHSKNTVERNGAFARGVDIAESVSPGVKAEILRGESPLTKEAIQQIAKLHQAYKSEEGFLPNLGELVGKVRAGKLAVKKLPHLLAACVMTDKQRQAVESENTKQATTQWLESYCAVLNAGSAPAKIAAEIDLKHARYDGDRRLTPERMRAAGEWLIEVAVQWKKL